MRSLIILKMLFYVELAFYLLKDLGCLGDLKFFIYLYPCVAHISVILTSETFESSSSNYIRAASSCQDKAFRPPIPLLLLQTGWQSLCVCAHACPWMLTCLFPHVVHLCLQSRVVYAFWQGVAPKTKSYAWCPVWNCSQVCGSVKLLQVGFPYIAAFSWHMLSVNERSVSSKEVLKLHGGHRCVLAIS